MPTSAWRRARTGQGTDARPGLTGCPDVVIVVTETLFIGPIHRCGRIVCWAVLDALTIDIEVHPPVTLIDRLRQPWRDQDPTPGPPVPRIDDKEVDAPVGIFQEEVFDVADLAVAGMDTVSGDRCNAAKVRIAAVSLSIGDFLLVLSVGAARTRQKHAVAELARAERSKRLSPELPL